MSDPMTCLCRDRTCRTAWEAGHVAAGLHHPECQDDTNKAVTPRDLVAGLLARINFLEVTASAMNVKAADAGRERDEAKMVAIESMHEAATLARTIDELPENVRLARRNAEAADLAATINRLAGDPEALWAHLVQSWLVRADVPARTSFAGLKIEGGKAEFRLRPPDWAVKALAASFAESLGDAENWRSVEVVVPHRDATMLVTVKRQHGDTPEATVTRLRDELKAAGRDAARLNWLEANAVQVTRHRPVGGEPEFVVYTGGSIARGATLREALDYAADAAGEG